MNTGKLIIFSAPSGAGKTTIVKHILNKYNNIEFSISATSREKREGEKHGKDYYYLSPSEFKQKIKTNDFLEWEEVYKDHYYGTLISEIERIRKNGNHVIFDVDVRGGLNIKKHYKKEALLIFVMPPNLQELERRLRLRKTETEHSIKERIAKANVEISFKDLFDIVIVNDDLNKTLNNSAKAVLDFIQDTP